jgi:hypothetical protein
MYDIESCNLLKLLTFEVDSKINIYWANNNLDEIFPYCSKKIREIAIIIKHSLFNDKFSKN